MSRHQLFPVPDDFETWPRERRAAWQLEQLRVAVRHAQERSDVYRELWGRYGLSVDSLASLEDIRRFPIVEKADVVEGRQAAYAPGTAVGFSTRGTSGQPLLVWVDEVEWEGFQRPVVRGFRWAGVREGDRALLLSPAWHRLAALEGHGCLELGADVCHFWGTIADTGHVEDFVQALRDLEPAFVTSTPPFLLAALRWCDAHGVDVRALFGPVRSVSLVGIALTPGLRRWLAGRLDADVFERGGTNEGAALDECHLHTGMHIHEDTCYLEVVDDDGEPCPEGVAGRFVVNKLVPGGVPFIRYDTGDRAAFLPGTCGCGVEFARLRLLGRPESTLEVAGVPVTAFEVRQLLDEHPDLVGRVSLLVRDDRLPDVLRVAIEGEPPSHDVAAQLAQAFGVEHVQLDWLHGARVEWGFRQVISVGELLAGR